MQTCLVRLKHHRVVASGEQAGEVRRECHVMLALFRLPPPEGGLSSSRLKHTCSPMGLVLIAMSVRVMVGLILYCRGEVAFEVAAGFR